MANLPTSTPFRFFSAIREKNYFTLLGIATWIQGNYHDDRKGILG